jgi:predicted MFS family arabinose efflux permease
MATTAGLIVAIGVLSAGGAGMAGPAVLMATTARLIPERHRGLASGIVNAGGSAGQFLMAPVAGALLVGLGWAGAMQVLGLLVLLALPAAFVLRGLGPSTARQPAVAKHERLGAGAAIRAALREPSYLMLAAGFFVCGFHVAFIATHLPGVVAACGLPPSVGAWSLATIGLFNIVGSFAIGWAMGRWRTRSLLSLLYTARALTVLAFLAAPKTELTFLLFSAAIGVTYLSTVPATGNLVAKLFGLRNMATLFGLVFLSHQVGGFLGAWLGGKAFVASGSYDWMWYADIALAIFAAIVHLPIREKPVAPPTAAAA